MKGHGKGGKGHHHHHQPLALEADKPMDARAYSSLVQRIERGQLHANNKDIVKMPSSSSSSKASSSSKPKVDPMSVLPNPK